MTKINNDKMWASLMHQCAMSDNPTIMEFYYLIRRCIKKQGLDINLTTAEIEGIKEELTHSEVTKKSDQDELTQFEGMLKHIVNKYVGNSQFMDDYEAKKSAKGILPSARKEFIEEACEWLDDNFYTHDDSSGRGIYSEVVGDGFDTVEEMINDFRKALEKGL